MHPPSSSSISSPLCRVSPVIPDCFSSGGEVSSVVCFPQQEQTHCLCEAVDLLFFYYFGPLSFNFWVGPTFWVCRITLSVCRHSIAFLTSLMSHCVHQTTLFCVSTSPTRWLWFRNRNKRGMCVHRVLWVPIFLCVSASVLPACARQFYNRGPQNTVGLISCSEAEFIATTCCLACRWSVIQWLKNLI